MSSPDEKEGLIIVIEERQKGTISPTGKLLELNTEGTIYIYNNTGSPLYDVEIGLKNVEYTNLPKKLTAGIIPTFNPEKGPTKFDYKIREKGPGVFVTETLAFPADIAKPVALLNQKIDLKIRYHFKNDLGQIMTVDFTRELPKQFVLEIPPTPETGSLSKEDDKLVLAGFEVPARSEKVLEIPVDLLAETVDAFRSGKTTWSYKGEGASISGIEIQYVKSTLNISYYVDKTERIEQRGIWDNYVIVENTTKAPIKVIAIVSIISGKILTAEEGGAEFKGTIEPKTPGRREYDTIVFEPVIINPGDTAKIGPFTIRSEGEPKLSADIEVYVLPEVIYKVYGEFSIEDIEIPVVWGKATKEVYVTHPPAYATADRYNLIAHLVEDVNVETVIENLGSAELDRIHVIETIPEDHKPPRPVDVKVYLVTEGGEIELPPEIAKVAVEPEDTDPSKPHKLSIDTIGLAYTAEKPMMKGDKLVIRYKIKSADPKPDKVYEYPSVVELAYTADTRPLVIELEEVPKIKTIAAVKKITKRKTIEPGAEPDVYVVILTLKNEGDLPESNYEVIEFLPTTFDLVEEQVEPPLKSVEETETGVLLRWIIPEIPAKSEVTVKYTVRGKPGHKVSDLLKIAE